MNEDQRVIYQQDCESFRYQDKLLWSRFQTLSVVEGAVASALFIAKIEHIAGILTAFVGLLVVFLFCVIAYKDHKDSKLFINRIMNFEQSPKASRIDPKRVLGMNAGIAILVIFAILLAFNIYLIIYAFGAGH